MLVEYSVSIVIPTCNRKRSLLRLLKTLNASSHPINKVIIVDSGVETLQDDDFLMFDNLEFLYLFSKPSVCVQRNIGIQSATTPWIFLCDDDLEVPSDYLEKIFNHISKHPEAGAVGGLFLQQWNNVWTGQYPITSTWELVGRFVFQLSIWGELKCKANLITKPVIAYYKRKMNHLSKAGWPVITNFEGEYFKTPVYTLGAAVVKKEWLLNSPFDEVLDKYGIGDNYGVAIGFPKEGIHLLNNAHVYHYKEPANRIQRSSQFYRRALAVDYFIKTRPELHFIKQRWFVWSLLANLCYYFFTVNFEMVRAICSFMIKGRNNNPYIEGKRAGLKVINPEI
jgi:glycosyltransferase involved in cell wall biosynthesis